MKRNNLNDYQKDYAVAKAAVQAIEEEIAKEEYEYIRNHGLTNSDSTFPEHIYCIEDEAVFKKANQEFGQIVVGKGLERDLNEAKRKLLKAEEPLLSYGISIAPEAIRAILKRGVDAHYHMRCKLLDMVFRLDTETVDRKS